MSTNAQLYNWQRFWSPRDAQINLSDRGFLVDPTTSTFAKAYNPELVTTQDLILEPCLVLLGEPGAGKSTELCKLYQLTQEKLTNSRNITLYYNLNNYSSDTLLVEEIFGNQNFKSWQGDSNNLFLFLDSLDEGLLTIKQLASTIGAYLAKNSNKRLFFRIACRTFDWPISLENKLINIWERDQVKVYEIAPLRKMDIAEAAKKENVDSTSFIEEIIHSEVVPLSIKPITLKLLFTIYKQHQNFPLTKSELYESGCKLLCDEINESRRDAHQFGTLSTLQRLTVAGRIAAVLLLSNRSTIFTGTDWGNLPITDLSIDSLIGSNEKFDDLVFPITKAEVLETLATGLFNSRGDERFGFAHQTYAEFAAGWYLAKSQLTGHQIQSLFFHPGDGGKRIIPQLHETAAWIASYRTDIYDLILQREPSILLLSDNTSVNEEQRFALVSSLLKLYEKEQYYDSGWNTYSKYERLLHSKLAEQLKVFIEDRTKDTFVRRTAIDIAEACDLIELQSDLLNLAIDQAEQMVLRTNAACALSRIGDYDTRKNIIALARGVEEDLDDELKGWSLQAIWPDFITTKELFELITPIKNPDLIGSYYLFLDGLRNKIGELNLEDALVWVQTQSEHDHLSQKITDLIDAIMIEAWEQINNPKILDLFAKATFNRITKLEGIISRDSAYFGGPTSLFLQSFEVDDKRRRLLIKALIDIFLLREKHDFYLLTFSPPQIVLQKDFAWLLEQLHTATNESMKQALSEVAWIVFDRNDPKHIEKAYISAQKEDLLAKEFLSFFGPIEIGSPLALSMKKTYETLIKWEEKRNNHPVLSPSPQERILNLLNEFENGNVDAWWVLTLNLTLKPDSTHYRDEFYRDVTKMPGWEEASTETKARIIKAAYEYLEKGEPNTSTWLGKNRIHRSALAGYRALFLFLKVNPDILRKLSLSTWKKWAPIVLAFPNSISEEQQELITELLKITYSYVPDEIIQTLYVIIAKENKEHKSIFVLSGLEIIMDEKMKGAIFEVVKSKSLFPESMYILLSELIKSQFPEAIVFAKSLITLPPPKRGKARIRSIIAAQALFQYSIDAGWENIWPVILKNKKFGQEMIDRMTNLPMRENQSIGKRLPEKNLADFCLWLFQQYPPNEDPNIQGVHCVSQREEIGHWRNELVSELTNRGTYEAYQAVQYLSSKLPKINWLKWQIHDAEMNYLRNSWHPFEPSQLLKLLSNPELRLVQSGEQLLDVIIESLARLQQILQGETPQSVFLWNELPNKKFRPKEENRLSDYIKNHIMNDIKNRGIIANREVEIRPTIGSMPGEKTDIRVDAFIRRPGGLEYDLISVIIETKCIWNDELGSAMENQLVKRYMKDALCRAGIYLVGWYECPQWDNTDSKRLKSQKYIRNNLEQELKNQALQLSENDIRIREYIMDVSLRHPD
ncbi:MAG: hypothetical protein GYA15_11895 [Leptolinea sp.]|jgi:hypothetical protein|nr:hypothetical protein [Leptolinea sp.]